MKLAVSDRKALLRLLHAARAYIDGPDDSLLDNGDNDAFHNERDRLYWRLLDEVDATRHIKGPDDE